MKKNIENMSNADFQTMDLEQKILSYTAGYEVPQTISREEALRRVKMKITEEKPVIVKELNREIIRLNWLTSIAAGLLVVFGLWYFMIRKPIVDVVALKGNHTEYRLPDGSQVSINADSKVSFKKKGFLSKRQLYMEGEAFFSVEKGSPFVINTKYADIKVLGTSFNVFARENSFKVSCVTGKVLVTANKKSVTITPGESAELIGDTLSKYNDKRIETIANWRIGEFYFENAGLKIIFDEIERQFNVKFVLPKLNEKYFTGSFSNTNLVNALDIVCIPMGLTYEIGSNSQVFIYFGSK
jgi:ferric-dicitrate binding protein FerR (iron transport regulator)